MPWAGCGTDDLATTADVASVWPSATVFDMSVEFALEVVADVLDEAQPLIQAHGREVQFFSGLEPDLDRDMFEKLDEIRAYD